MRSRTTAALALALALGVLSAPPAAGAGLRSGPTWGPVVGVGRAASASRPEVVLGDRGVATVAWRSGKDIVVRRRSADGAWGATVRIGGGTAPHLGIDGTGRVTAVWTRQLPGHGPQVMTSRHVSGAHWSDPLALTPSVQSQGNSAHGAFDARLAVARDGSTLVCWLHEADDSGASRVQARYRPAGGAWRGVATLSPVEARTPECAIGDDGRAVVVYTVFARVFAVRRTVDGWTPRVRVGLHAEPPRVAVDDTADAAVVWSSFGEGGTFRPQASTGSTPGTTWAAAETLDTADLDSTSEPVVAMTPQGRATVAWVRSDGQVVTSDHEPGGSWSDPATGLGSGAVRGAPWLALSSGRSGALLLTWQGRDADARRVRAAYRTGAGVWQDPVLLTPAGLRADAAHTSVGTGGRAVAAWRAYDADGVARIQVRVLTP